MGVVAYSCEGSFSAASVGGQPSRRILMEPLFDRVFYAGEAAHETLVGHGRRCIGNLASAPPMLR